MSRNNLILIIFVALVLLVIGGSILSIEWEKVEVETGLTSDASKQPLLAAQLLLKQYNASLEKLERSNSDDFYLNEKLSLATNSTLVMDEGALNEYPGIDKAILRWLKSGGHLVYILSPRRNQLILDNNSLMLESLTVLDSETPARRHSFVVPAAANVNIKNDQQNFDIYLTHQFTFDNCPGTAIKAHESELALICEVPVAQGHITYLPSIDLIATSNLHRLDHGQFLLWLLGNNEYMFYLPSTISTNWIVSLLNWSWQIILLVVIFFVGWIWHLAMRLGLPSEPHSSSKNIFSAHIEAVGNFMVEHNHHQSLKAALVKDLDSIMEKRIANYKHLSVQEQAQQLSSITKKHSQTIEQLLSEELPVDSEERLQYIKLFKELRNSL